MKGLSRSNLLYMRKLAEVWAGEAIVPQLVGQLPWGHNAAEFDWPFLRAWYKHQDIFCPIANEVLCTLQRARWWFAHAEHPEVAPPGNFRLGTLCGYFGVPLEAAAHDALADVRATVDLYRMLRLPVQVTA